MATLDPKIIDGMPVNVVASEQALCDTFAPFSSSALIPTPPYLFRGQASRWRRKWPPVTEPGFAKHALSFESLIPTDYRMLEERLERGESRTSLDPIYGDRIAQVRALDATYLMQCHSCWGDAQVQAWVGALTPPAKADKLLSIGQHYGLRTHFLDLTSDWEVALWFASHRWTGEYIPGGDGVIYRIDTGKLGDAEKAANTALGITTAKDACRHVDIRDTPAAIAPRARAQRGFSLINVESPHFLQAMIQQKAVEAFVFPRGAGPAPGNSLSKDMLAPPHDEMAALFEQCKAGRMWPDVVRWLRQPGYGHLGATDIDHQHMFA